MRVFAPQAVEIDASAGKHHPVVRRSLPAPVAPVSTVHSEDALLQRQGNCACGGGCPGCAQETHPETIQTKLQVSNPGDQFEQEADQIAAQVMESQATPMVQRSGNGAGQAACREDGCQKTLQPKTTDAIDPMSGDVSTSLGAQLGPGQPLDPATRAFMEPRFGRELAHVRVHTDARAAESARRVNARAYTVGSDIVFAAGAYAPEGSAGKHLLAHELTHTVQQASSRQASIQRKVQVGAGLTLDTQGFTTSKTGDVYTCPAIVKNSVWNEIFTSLLFSARVFKVGGTSNAEVSANFQKHMAGRYGIVQFASKKKYDFGAGPDFRMNPDYWIVDATGYRPKPGVEPLTAIKDLNVHPKEYAIACQAATVLTMQGGSESLLAEDSGVTDDDWIPGDWGYILNTKFPPGGQVGLEGENIIYTGKDKFWGHFGPGVDYRTLKEWFDEVQGWHKGALIKSVRRRPIIGLL